MLNDNKQFKMTISPSILSLLGPNLYSNIYYVLSELIANAYDADAHNVYICQKRDKMIVEDDGKGMSYKDRDFEKYLKVGECSRHNEQEAFTENHRRKMGRKGIGKLAALSIAPVVDVMSIVDGEKSGCTLQQSNNEENLPSIPEKEIELDFVEPQVSSGTRIVMHNPTYRLNSSIEVIKKNILKMFPFINEDFRVHVKRGDESTIVIDKFDGTISNDFAALITLGDEFSERLNNFKPSKSSLLDNRGAKTISIKMQNNLGQTVPCDVIIKGWIGALKSVKRAKQNLEDFNSNFLSIFANNKLGEFDVLPTIKKNKLNEVYVVGQIHCDILENSDLPDIALSNRQGYKNDDPRYKCLLNFLQDNLLPHIVKMRTEYSDLTKKDKEIRKNQKKLS